MAAEFNLPGSSLAELNKIIQAYGHFSDKASGQEVANLAGVHRTTISRSAKFLVDAGVLSLGAQKNLTDLGRKLARAIEHDVTNDIARYWREAVSQNEKFSKLITKLRIKGGMTEKAFSDHVLYVSGVKKTKPTETGARTVVDILLAANMITEQNGQLGVSAGTELASESSRSEPIADTEEEHSETAKVSLPTQSEVSADVKADTRREVVSINPNPQVTINIQLHIPEVSDSETYDRLFKALADNLFPPKDVT